MLDPGNVQQRGGDIGKVGQFFSDPTPFDSRSLHNERHMHPALHPAILGGHRRAVISTENKIGILINPQLLGFTHQFTDQLVHVLDQVDEALLLLTTVLGERLGLFLPAHAGCVRLR